MIPLRLDPAQLLKPSRPAPVYALSENPFVEVKFGEWVKICNTPMINCFIYRTSQGENIMELKLNPKLKPYLRRTEFGKNSWDKLREISSGEYWFVLNERDIVDVFDSNDLSLPKVVIQCKSINKNKAGLDVTVLKPSNIEGEDTNVDRNLARTYAISEPYALSLR